MNETGLKVLAIVLDQGTNNTAAIKRLLDSSSSNQMTVDGSPVYLFFDVPHLLKNTRNNLKEMDSKTTREMLYLGLTYRDCVNLTMCYN